MSRNPLADLVVKIEEEQNSLSRSVLSYPNKDKFELLAGQYQGLENAKKIALSLLEGEDN